MKLADRLGRLEAACPARCAACRGRPSPVRRTTCAVYLPDNGRDRPTSPVVATADPEEEARCPQCGWTPAVVEVAEVVVYQPAAATGTAPLG